jgi:hypothetical protein
MVPGPNRVQLAMCINPDFVDSGISTNGARGLLAYFGGLNSNFWRLPNIFVHIFREQSPREPDCHVVSPPQGVACGPIP